MFTIYSEAGELSYLIDLDKGEKRRRRPFLLFFIGKMGKMARKAIGGGGGSGRYVEVLHSRRCTKTNRYAVTAKKDVHLFSPVSIQEMHINL